MKLEKLLSKLFSPLFRHVVVTAAAIVNFNLVVQNVELAPNGISRSTVASNGQFPAPLITGNVGDRFLINVTNNLTDASMRRATSIHWHGLFQRGTAEMDGTSFVSQCPIVPGYFFLYNFSVPHQSGTYWYHAHLSTQYCDGLRGPLVIYDPQDPHGGLYDVDDVSTVVTIADWYNQVSPALFPNEKNKDPLPDSILINGKGLSINGGHLTVIRARPGKRHRFRLINMSCLPSYTFSIDSHNMTIIETDGVETEPLTVDSLEIYAGQRYSVIVTADKAIDNYWIRAISSDPIRSNTTRGGISAILRYDGASESEPVSTENPDPFVMNEADLQPLIDPGAPGEKFVGGADVIISLPHDRVNGLYTVNGVTFDYPSVPVLLQILSGATDATTLLPSGSVYILPPNKVVEVNMPGGLIKHPFHLHGHTFDVIRVAGNSTYNFDNPVRRDVVNIGLSSDNVTFRFVTDNAGPWFLHCHIDWHLEGGLAVVFVEDPGRIASSKTTDVDWASLCPMYSQMNPDTHFA